MSENTAEFFKDASKNGKAYAVDKQFEDTIAQLQLTKLLGRPRFQQLTKAEKQMRAADEARMGIGATD